MTQQATASWPQQSSPQDVSASSFQYPEQCTWQDYYNYAQQLYSMGDEEQANRYYSYAQLLYNATLQAEPEEYVAPISSPPAWESYYNYAQQLYAAGYQSDAEAYYRQAQQLYSEAERQSVYPASTQAASDSFVPQYAGNASNSYVPQPAVSTSSSYVPGGIYAEGAMNQDPYAAQQPSFATTGGAVQSTAAAWHAWSGPDMSAKPSKRRSWKKRLKIWATVILVSAPLVGIGGVLLLFDYYQDHLTGTDAKDIQDDSFLGAMTRATIEPMVDALKPAFDKTIRLSTAAQPLLYELSLRDTPPPASDWKASDADISSADPARATQPSSTDPPKTAFGEGPVIPALQNEVAKATAPETPAVPIVPATQAVLESPSAPPAQAAPQALSVQAAPTMPVEPSFQKKDTDKPSVEAAVHDVNDDSSAKAERPSKNSSAHHRRHSKRRSRNRQDTVESSRSGTTEHRRAGTEKRNGKSGLSDDPMGNFNF
jgi:hypothetical protein